MIPLRREADGVSFEVAVQPRSSRAAVEGEREGALRVRLTAPPVDGAANKQCVALLAKVLGVPRSALEIVSGAGRDACYMARVAPTSMIFVPCIDGISHNEIEDAKPEWLTAGANVLLRAMLERAGVAAS